MKTRLYSQSGDFGQTRNNLLERVRNQDDDSWQEFVTLYRPYLRSICKRMNLPHHDTEDILQQVIIRLWDKVSEFDHEDRRRFRTWLGTVTRDTAGDFFRKRNRTARGTDLSLRAGPDCNDTEVSRIAEEEWKKYCVSMAIDRIRDQFPPKAISVFLDLQQGLPRNTVADLYNLTPDSVSAYKGRVLSALCAEIRALEGEL